ncbi:Ubiquitin carboxyl-terminal hydrolase 47 [Parelaphostrongylus tenuis]|uniref:Ubiquitin carboxyl-terminal hydrolase 47 n=1 Tax=Parelaphostrongylus tenuis TaxID=148309 RepID=A0AAD5MQC2_PARTN|nr:Ubiquitin carboxyl-terminal hydrolase 47 [Parelaphostrongylus tenuis]
MQLGRTHGGPDIDSSMNSANPSTSEEVSHADDGINTSHDDLSSRVPLDENGHKYVGLINQHTSTRRTGTMSSYVRRLRAQMARAKMQNFVKCFNCGRENVRRSPCWPMAKSFFDESVIVTRRVRLRNVFGNGLSGKRCRRTLPCPYQKHGQGRWYCFSETRVEPVGPEEISKSFGGSFGGWSTSMTNAYMLMYRKMMLKLSLVFGKFFMAQ